MGGIIPHKTDLSESKPFVSKRKRGPVQETDYDFSGLHEKHVNKYQMRTKSNVETQATWQYLTHIEGKQTFDTINDVVKHYSSYTFEKEEEVKTHIADLRQAANDYSRWKIVGANNPNQKSAMKQPLVEKYCDFAINLGINNEMDTELNMSPEGKLRRKALYAKDMADKYFEDFRKKYHGQGQDTKLNLTLKRNPE